MDFTELLVLNNNEELEAVLSNEGAACPYYNDELTMQVNGVLSLKFTVPRDHPDAAFLDEGATILFRLKDDPEGEFHEYRVVDTDAEHADNMMMDVICEHARAELLDNLVKDRRPTNATVATALGNALEGSRWLVGTTADLGVNSTSFYYIKSLDAIRKILDTWGGEVRFRTIVTENRITARYVDILARLGADTGEQFEYGRDTDTIRRSIDRTTIKTALYGRGMGEQTETGGYGRRLTFADVVWSKANGDPVDKPAGQEWVGDDQARDLYGYPISGGKQHRFDEVIFDQETDATLLLQKTWDALQETNAPLIQYECTINDIGKRVDLGDTIIVIDDDMGVSLEARVIEIKGPLDQEDISRTVKLGNFLPSMYGSDTDQKVDDLQKMVEDNQPRWDNTGISEVSDNEIANVAPTVPVNFVASGSFDTVILEWTFDPSIVVAAYELYASQVMGFTPDASNLIYRGKSSGYNHTVGSNQQWYYRIRAINPHGTASGYSAEKSASTARIQTADIMFGAVNAQILADLAVEAGKLADGSVGTGKLVDDAITNAKIAANAVLAEQINNGAVNNAKLADLAVTAAKLANGAVGTTQLAIDAVTNEKLADLAVQAAQLADGAVIEAKIGTGAITNTKLGALAVDAAKLKDLAVTATKIANLAVGSAAIADLAVTNAKIGDLAVNSAEIADAAIIAAKIGSLAVGNAAIQNGAVTNAKIANLAVSNAQIQDAAVTSAKIANLAVGTAAIQDAAITNAKIANITAEKILVSGGVTKESNLLSGLTSSGTTISTGATDGSKDIGAGYVQFGGGNSTDSNGELEYLQYDLGAVYRIQESRLYFYSGDERYYWYKIKYSVDGVDWLYAVGTGDANGWKRSMPKGQAGTSKHNPTIDQFALPIVARYVRVYANGNSVNTGNHLYEWELYSANQTFIHGDNVLTGTVTATQMATGTITAASGIIANAAIESAKIAALAVGNAAIANLAVTNAKIGNLAVDTAQIADAAIENAKIANLAVTGAKIADATITDAKIANATITSAKIASIDAGKITTGTLKAITIDGATIYSKSATSQTTITGGKFESRHLTYNYNTLIEGGEITSTFGADSTRISGGAVISSGAMQWGGQVRLMDIQYPSFDRADVSHFGLASMGKTDGTGRWLKLAQINNTTDLGSSEFTTFQGRLYIQRNYGNTANDTVGPIDFNFGVRGGTIKPVVQWSGGGPLTGGAYPQLIVTKWSDGSYYVYAWQPAYSRFATCEYQLPGGFATFQEEQWQGTVVWNSADTMSASANVQTTRFGHDVKINSDGGQGRWQANSSNYIVQNPTNGLISFYMGGSAIHTFNSSGGKSGGSIKIDDRRYGMSPIDSPQFLVEYIEFDVQLENDIDGVKVYLDETYAKAVNGKFAVFPNNGTVIEKGADYFVIKGEGLADCRIVGERYDFAGAFWADMDLLTQTEEGDYLDGVLSHEETANSPSV